MPLSPHNFLQHFYGFLTVSAASRSLPMSLLLIGLEELIEQIFSCPCDPKWNKLLVAFIFSGPALFIFALMFILLRPFKIGCGADVIMDILHCLIPPVMWVIILFLDGDYLACIFTKLEGIYVFDEELKRKWCPPSISINKSEHNYLVYIGQSQFYGYAVLAGFSFIMVLVVGVVDCYKSGTCCRRYQQAPEGQQGLAEAVPQRGAQSGEQEEVQEGAILLKITDSANAEDNAESSV